MGVGDYIFIRVINVLFIVAVKIINWLAGSEKEEYNWKSMVNGYHNAL